MQGATMGENKWQSPLMFDISDPQMDRYDGPTDGTDYLSAWSCCPEWCELGADPHDDTCPEHKIEMTKAFFVGAMGNIAETAIDAYRVVIDAQGDPDAGAVDTARGEAEEAAACFAGIGSCGRGWCQHS